MTQQTIDPIVEDVLSLLVFVITADAKIYQEEIDSFLSVAAGMPLSDTEGNVLTRGWLFDWFLQNCEPIRAQTASAEAESKIVHLFVRLQSWQDKNQLLDALRSVAASDGQYHLNEKVLIALAAAYWDAETPAMN
jgi:uncharacterized tellurite resistance protein B-like protein